LLGRGRPRALIGHARNGPRYGAGRVVIGTGDTILERPGVVDIGQFFVLLVHLLSGLLGGRTLARGVFDQTFLPALGRCFQFVFFGGCASTGGHVVGRGFAAGRVVLGILIVLFALLGTGVRLGFLLLRLFLGRIAHGQEFAQAALPGHVGRAAQP
jgi:hypothetical protein